mgnify:CR=1 FL=1
MMTFVLELDKKVELEIIDLAETHIKKVELNPEVKTEGDNFDYWNAYRLEDGNFIDYNIYMGDEMGEINPQTGEFEYYDCKKWSWDCSAYAVDPPKTKDGYHEINTNIYKHLFSRSYNKKGEVKTEYHDK